MDRLQKRVDADRQRLYDEAAGLLGSVSPNDAGDARRQLDQCSHLVSQVFALQHDIEHLIQEDGPSDGRHRAAAVAALAEGTVRLRESLLRLHLHGFELKNDQLAPMTAIEDERSDEALRLASQAIAAARQHVVKINNRSQRTQRLLRSVLVLVRLSKRAVDDIGATDLEMGCDQVDEIIEGLASTVADEINSKLGDQLSLLSSAKFSDSEVLRRILAIIGECMTTGRSPEDRSHPLLRLRLLEMINLIMELPSNWINLRWTALLYSYVGWIELFAAYACRTQRELERIANRHEHAEAFAERASGHVQQSRNFYQTGRRWAVESKLHRRWDLRLTKALSYAGLDRAFPDWGQTPARREIEACLGGLVRAISLFTNTTQ